MGTARKLAGGLFKGVGDALMLRQAEARQRARERREERRRRKEITAEAGRRSTEITNEQTFRTELQESYIEGQVRVQAERNKGLLTGPRAQNVTDKWKTYDAIMDAATSGKGSMEGEVINWGEAADQLEQIPEFLGLAAMARAKASPEETIPLADDPLWAKADTESEKEADNIDTFWGSEDKDFRQWGGRDAFKRAIAMALYKDFKAAEAGNFEGIGEGPAAILGDKLTGATGDPGKYNTREEVKAAYEAGEITRAEATKLLEQFGPP